MLYSNRGLASNLTAVLGLPSDDVLAAVVSAARLCGGATELGRRRGIRPGSRQVRHLAPNTWTAGALTRATVWRVRFAEAFYVLPRPADLESIRIKTQLTRDFPHVRDHIIVCGNVSSLYHFILTLRTRCDTASLVHCPRMCCSTRRLVACPPPSRSTGVQASSGRSFWLRQRCRTLCGPESRSFPSFTTSVGPRWRWCRFDELESVWLPRLWYWQERMTGTDVYARVNVMLKQSLTSPLVPTSAAQQRDYARGTC